MKETLYSLDYIKQIKSFLSKNETIKICGNAHSFAKNKSLANKDGEELNHGKIIELKRIKNSSRIRALIYKFLLRYS